MGLAISFRSELCDSWLSLPLPLARPSELASPPPSMAQLMSVERYPSLGWIHLSPQENLISVSWTRLRRWTTACLCPWRRRPTWLALGPSLVPTNNHTHRFHCIPFRDNRTVCPRLVDPRSHRSRAMRRHRTPAISQTRGSCKAWVHRAANRTGHRRQGNSLSTIRNLRHFPSGVLLPLGPHTPSMIAARFRGTVSTILLRWPRHRLCQWAISKDQ
ncbi:hypothetical protein BKA62DRAFT_723265 [Auriculariales sp. MPI-PUGE-AT-0066]|nr:hypothetical protein BKA62DRAFT_723265 [Auriculariales sp. MPI-PUGE-AT-0066]